MQTVSRFEANLLRILYYFLRREPAERALPLVDHACEAPTCLSRAAVRLVQSALARGTVLLLGHRGAWRVERHLRGERGVEGRLWQRTRPEELGLSFSQHAMEFLIWITAAQPRDKKNPWQPAHEELTTGDLMLLFWAHEGLREAADSVGADVLRVRAPYNRHALCWLAYPEDFTEVPEGVEPDFTPWMEGAGACILEALQPDLAQRWVEVEGRKERITNPQRMRALGVAQERVLRAFLDAAERAERRDLARFLLRATALLLTDHASPAMWIGGLHTTGLRLADRAAVYQASLAYVRQVERLRGWTRWARGIGYWDEGYHAAQLWKADWDTYGGDEAAGRAQTIVRLTDPLRQATGPAEGEQGT